MQTPAVSVQLYLIEYVRVSRVEEVGQPLLYPSDNLRPHRVHQEIITWYYISFVTEGRDTSTLKYVSISNTLVTTEATDSFYALNPLTLLLHKKRNNSKGHKMKSVIQLTDVKMFKYYQVHSN